jgi:hypothetical protein
MAKYIVENGIVPANAPREPLRSPLYWVKQGILRTKITITFPDGQTRVNKSFAPMGELLLHAETTCRKDCTYVFEDIIEEA